MDSVGRCWAVVDLEELKRLLVAFVEVSDIKNRAGGSEIHRRRPVRHSSFVRADATALFAEPMAVGIDAVRMVAMNSASFQSLTRLRSGTSGPICSGTPPVKRGPWHWRRS